MKNNILKKKSQVENGQSELLRKIFYKKSRNLFLLQFFKIRYVFYSITVKQTDKIFKE